MTRHLLDTHVLLWSLAEPERLRARHREVLSRDAALLVSHASLWEIEIEASLGKLTRPDGFMRRIESLGAELLPITLDHISAVGRLPHHHGDPFDRMLIAQAVVERLPIVTADRAFAAYDVRVL